MLYVIFQKRVRVFHRGFQTRENWWKHEAVGRVLLLFSSVCKPRWNTKHEFLKLLLNRASLTKNNEKNLTDFGIVRMWNINYLFGYCFSVIIGLCCQILAVSQVPEDRHCLKRNTYTSFNLSSVIVKCQVFGKPKQPKKRLIWFQTRYPSPPNTKVNGLMECSKSGKGSGMKYGQVSDIFAPKCSSTGNVSCSREVQNYRRSWWLSKYL